MLGAAAASAEDVANVVKQRQDLMKQQGRELVAVRNYLQGKGDQAAAVSALALVAKSVPTVPNYFPPGSGMGEVSVKTRAKPEIWREHDKFLQDAKTVSAQIAALDTAVKAEDKTKAEALFKEINFCDACHKTFRAPQR